MNPMEKISSAGIAGINRPQRPEIKSNPSVGGNGAIPFSDLLEDRLQKSPLSDKLPSAGSLGELKFSAHAQTRMQSRGIELSPDEVLKIKDAVDRAGAKGSRESLILTDKAAFVVSVRNGTVITAIDRDSLKENVFTNIDSTVMI